jgi:hypothetical protein
VETTTDVGFVQAILAGVHHTVRVKNVKVQGGLIKKSIFVNVILN